MRRGPSTRRRCWVLGVGRARGASGAGKLLCVTRRRWTHVGTRSYRSTERVTPRANPKGGGGRGVTTAGHGAPPPGAGGGCGRRGAVAGGAGPRRSSGRGRGTAVPGRGTGGDNRHRTTVGLEDGWRGERQPEGRVVGREALQGTPSSHVTQ